MAERGAKPNVPKARQRALHAVRSLFTPLLPDDYLELINPLWSTQELRGRIERIERETADAVTVLIRPGYEWRGPPARPVPADRRRRRRRPPLARLLADLRPGPARRLHRDHPEAGRRGQGLALPRAAGAARATSSASAASKAPSSSPTRRREKLLFISAGSGITPIMSMLRSLDRDDALDDVVHIHSARTADGVIFGEQLRELDARRRRLPACTCGSPARRAASRPPTSTRSAPTGASARPSSPARARCSTRWSEHWRARGRPGAAGDGALPAGDRRRRRRRRGRHDPLPHERHRGRVRRRHADPRRRRGGRRRAALRLPDGDLPHLRRRALLGRGAGPAHRRGPRQRGRDGPDLRQRARRAVEIAL